jgi:hypothetical protein
MGACNMAADAQGTEGGERGQRSFNLAGFDAVSLAGPHDVVVTVGSGHSVRAEGDRTALDRLEIEVDGGNLKIGTKKGNWPMDWSKGRAKTTIYVSLPAIRAAAIAGSGDMRVDRVRADRFAGSIAGSGDLQIASMQVTDAKFSVAGSGNISAAGAAQRSTISIAGSGEVNLAGVESRSAEISVMGSGDVTARAAETANVSIMGSGDVTIAGSPRCTVSKRGSGSVRCGA